MTTLVRRFPKFIIKLITEKTTYELTYDTGEQLTQNDFESAVLSLSTKNSMMDDSPVFSLVVIAKDKWDTIINSNDLITIQIYPDPTKAQDNSYVMVGMISDIHREGEYSDGTLLYRITGRGMVKALIDFEVGVIQEVATVIPTIGWLPDGEENGLKFSGNTAAGIGEELMERFVYKYAQYDFSNGKALQDYLTYHFSSWKEDESLADPTPFINYEGSIRQFLEDVAAKPFNELFSEFTSDGRCTLLMRPTPFDNDKWTQLPTAHFTSDVVVQESFGKSDAETYSVFVVQAPNLAEFNSVDLGVFPKTHPELIKKYGYKRLDAQNRYLLTETIANASTEPSTEPPAEGETPQVPMPNFEELLATINENNYMDAEKLRKERNTIIADLITKHPGLTEVSAGAILDAVKEQDFTRERYTGIVAANGSAQDQAVNEEREIAGEKLEKFTNRLFNWYCENVNFYSGDIRIVGNPTYRVGSRVFYEDFERGTIWEFYIESIQHEFSFSNGYTTVLGVTRGLPEKGRMRFSNLYNQAEEFKGGYLGEPSLEDLVNKAKEANAVSGTNPTGSFGNWGGSQGSGGAMGALQMARELTGRSSVYVFGGGRTGNNPFQADTIRIDCSAFIWWIFHLNGVDLKGGKTGMTTDTIAVDPQLKTISARGSSKENAKSMLQLGDLVYFDTYKKDGHIGIYSGNGKFIGSQSSTGIAEADMTSGYYWKKFNGHVKRL